MKVRATSLKIASMRLRGSADFLRGLGADEVFDHRTTRPEQLEPSHVVPDAVGTQHAAYRALLAPGGRMVSIAFDLDHVVRSLGYILASAARGTGRVRLFSGRPERDLLVGVARHVEAGDIRPVVDTVRPLADLAVAHRALEAGASAASTSSRSPE